MVKDLKVCMMLTSWLGVKCEQRYIFNVGVFERLIQSELSLLKDHIDKISDSCCLIALTAFRNDVLLCALREINGGYWNGTQVSLLENVMVGAKCTCDFCSIYIEKYCVLLGKTKNKKNLPINTSVWLQL